MVRKSSRPHPKESRSRLDEFLRRFFIAGKRPEVVHDDFCTGRITPSLKRTITNKISALLNVYDYLKIGKTGDHWVRTDFEDYRGNFSHMYLIYRSSSTAFVSELEELYIAKFLASHPEQVLNRRIKSPGKKMVSFDGYYYLYVVVN